MIMTECNSPASGFSPLTIASRCDSFQKTILFKNVFVYILQMLITIWDSDFYDIFSPIL